MRRSGCALALIAGFAAAPKAQMPDCTIESLPAARAACLELAADGLIAWMDGEIERFGLSAQGASAETLASFLGQARARQARWAAGLAARCAGDGRGNRLAAAECRLAEAEARASRIAALLSEAEDALGAAPAGRGADYAGYPPRLEIRPLPRGGFALDVVIDALPPD